MAYRLVTRAGPRVQRERFGDLDAAMHALEERGRDIQDSANARPVSTLLGRSFEPEQQVLARLELSGSGRVRAGVDVRGDGSAHPYSGRIRRTPLESLEGESAYDTLRRALMGESER